MYFLRSAGLTRLDVVKYISHSSDDDFSQDTDEVELEGGEEKQPGKKKETALEKFTINFAEQVEKGRIDPLIGREEELQRVMQILCRRRKNNPLLVGEPGVGKTAIAEGLALEIHREKVPELIKGMAIHLLDMGFRFE